MNRNSIPRLELENWKKSTAFQQDINQRAQTLARTGIVDYQIVSSDWNRSWGPEGSLVIRGTYRVDHTRHAFAEILQMRAGVLVRALHTCPAAQTMTTAEAIEFLNDFQLSELPGRR